MKPNDKNIICERDFSPLSATELMAEIELYLGIALNSPLRDPEPEEILGPARALLARVEAAEGERNIAARRAFNAEVENQRLTTDNRRLSAELAALKARVAELEAAQQWRPGSETPVPDWYQTVETIEGVLSHACFDGASWHGYYDNLPPLWYRPIPPLPPAPNVQETTP